jgi:tetratricopeptide (TPR) repeat protein
MDGPKTNLDNSKYASMFDQQNQGAQDAMAIGAAYEKRKDYRAAVDYYEKAYKSVADRPILEEAYLRIGRLVCQDSDQPDYEWALRLFRKIWTGADQIYYDACSEMANLFEQDKVVDNFSLETSNLDMALAYYSEAKKPNELYEACVRIGALKDQGDPQNYSHVSAALAIRMGEFVNESYNETESYAKACFTIASLCEQGKGVYTPGVIDYEGAVEYLKKIPSTAGQIYDKACSEIARLSAKLQEDL